MTGPSARRTCPARRCVRRQRPRVDGGESRAVGLGRRRQARAALCHLPRRQGRPVRSHQLRARKDGRSRRCAGSSKWRTGGRGGRVSHSHKGRGPFPPQLLLPVTPLCAGPSWHLDFYPGLWSGASPVGGGDLTLWSFSTLGGWRPQLGQLGIGYNSPWNLPFKFGSWFILKPLRPGFKVFLFFFQI